MSAEIFVVCSSLNRFSPPSMCPSILSVTFLTGMPRSSAVLFIMSSISYIQNGLLFKHINLLTPNDPYSGRTAPLTSKSYILYIYSTNTGTEYFKHGINSPFFPLQNAVCFIILTYLVPVLFTFYIQGVLKFKKIIPAPKG